MHCPPDDFSKGIADLIACVDIVGELVAGALDHPGQCFGDAIGIGGGSAGFVPMRAEDAAGDARYVTDDPQPRLARSGVVFGEFDDRR